MKYKYITIAQVGDEIFNKKPVYRILNNKSQEQLGMIHWYASWNKYVFSTKENIVFDEKCLTDITDFITQISKVSG